MKKKLKCFLLVLTFFTHNGYATCNDEPFANTHSETIKNAYNVSDGQIEAKLKELQSKISTTLNNENKNKELLSNSLVFEINSIVSLKELDFLQIKDIQAEKQHAK